MFQTSFKNAQHVRLREGHRSDQGLGGETISLHWPRNTLGCPSQRMDEWSLKKKKDVVHSISTV